jgi:hypothetical protein
MFVVRGEASGFRFVPRPAGRVVSGGTVMGTWASDDDGYDGVQYDDFYAPSAQQIEAEEIRRECYRLDDDSEANRVEAL